MKLQEIRRDFPILNTSEKDKNIIYVDNACVTLKPIQVINAINSYYKDFPACGGRSLHKLGKKVTEEVNKTRWIIKKFFNAEKDEEIVFTKNTTEGINLLAHSLNLSKDDIIVTSDKEHNSNLLPWQILKEKGVKHRIVCSNEDNSFNIEEFGQKMNEKVKFVSIVHTSNLDGYTNPIKEIIKIAHENEAIVLVDAAQSAPHKVIDVRKLDADFLVCSGHKMLGPSGTGILYGKLDLLKNLKPFLVGGETVKDVTYTTHTIEDVPEKFEAGLQDYGGIIGLGEAIKYLTRIGMENIEKHETELNKKISNKLANMPQISILGPKNPELRSGIISFNIKGTDPHDVAIILDESFNIAVRSGVHCVHSWFNAHNINGCVRASLYLYNTLEECDLFVEAISKILNLTQ